MKKIISIIAVALVAISTVSAQSFKKGDNVLQATAGLGTHHGLPVTLSYERGVYDINDVMAIGVGGVLGCNTKHSNVFAGVSGIYHFTKFNNWDLNAGLTLGYNQYDDNVLYDISLGAKYYITDSFGIAGSLGWGVSFLQLGVAYKF